MKTDNQTETRTIHPKVLKELPLDVIMELLKVGQDLRTGVIIAEQFNMADFDIRLYDKAGNHCGTAHCIAGWVASRMGRNHHAMFYGLNGPAALLLNEHVEPPLRILFYNRPSDPQMAADAIEQYVYNYAADPWKAAGYTGPYFY